MRIADINLAIKVRGSDFELVKGKGYFYFISKTHMLFDESVYVTRLNDLTLDRWLGELRYKINETNRRSYSLKDIPNLKE